MKRLYQWFGERASLFSFDRPGQKRTRTVRTEMTVQRADLTLLVESAAAGLDRCPLCGQKLATAQAEQARLRLRDRKISQEDLPVDGTSP
jgi:hypothetical protein